MKTPIRNLITRASLTATASHNAAWFARLLVGGVLGSTVSQAAVENFWTGAVDSNWNTDGNWSFGHAPLKTGLEATNEHAVIDTTPANIATITMNMTPTPTDIIVRGSGRLDHRSGTAVTGGGNWMYVGQNGGSNSIYNLADTTTPAGGISGYAQGSGTMNVSGRLYVGGAFGGGGTGVMNVNTTGTLSIGTRLYVGMNDGIGTVNMESGTMQILNDLAVGSGTGVGVMTVNGGSVTTGGWNFIGKNEEGDNSSGTLIMNGGSLTNTGRTYVAQQTCTGILTLSGGDYLNVNNEQFIVGENAGSNGTINVSHADSLLQIGGELWLGQNGGTGTMNVSAGQVTVNNWTAIGRANNAVGVLNLSGTGSFTKTGGNDFIVGSDGTGASGTITQTGGTMTVNTSPVSIGRAGGSAGAWTLSAGTASLDGELRIGENGTGTLTMTGGTMSVDGNLNVGQNSGSTGHMDLDGGTLNIFRINGGAGADTVDFNGTQINAGALEPAFIANLNTALLQGGGLRINTNGFAVGVPQVLSGSGGVIKTGAGTLTLSGSNEYSGATMVNAGRLNTSSLSFGGGDVTVANGTTLGVAATFFDSQFNVANASFGSGGATTLEINNSAAVGNPTLAPVNVTGNLSINGTATINLVNALPAVGSFPLVKYEGTLTGTFTLGTLPPGIAATLVHDVPNKLFRLNITSAALPRWDGAASNVWDTSTTPGTENWIDQATNNPIFFANGNPALFDDTLSVPPENSAIDIPGTVLPSAVTFNNLFTNYSLSGAGKIGGTGGLMKQGAANLVISTTNDYTGVTTLEGGVTTVAALTNGGVASPLGAASSAPGNLVFAGGTLDYTGGDVVINRGYTVGAADNALVSTLNIVGNVEITGQVVSTLGGFVKGGAGTLTLSNPGANSLANNGFRVAEGNLVFNGATQTNTVTGLFNIGGGVVTTVNNATVAVTGGANVGGSAGGTGELNLNGTAVFSTTDRILVGTGGVGNSGSITIAGSSQLNQTGGWIAVGHEAGNVGTLTVKDSGVFNHTGNDFNISDVTDSTGFLTLQDSGVINSVNTYWGKNGGTVATVTLSGGTYNCSGAFLVALLDNSTGMVTQTGGTVNHTGGEFMISRDGDAIWNQSAGIVNANGWVILGRNLSGNGTLNISGGSFTQTSLDRPLMVGEFGAGTINMSGTAVVNSLGANGLILANEPGGFGTLNLDGGTLTVRRVREGNDNNNGAGGTSSFTFDGGLLRAGANANATFMAGLDSAIVEDGGANIDTNGQNITVGQALDDDGTGIGGLTKTGAGTLNLNGFNTYKGDTLVTTGTLGGNGFIDGEVVVGAGANLAPGTAADALSTTGDVSFDDGDTANLVINVNDAAGATTGLLEVGGNLDVADANLVLNGTLTLPTYVIATYGTKTGAQFNNHGSLVLAPYSINYGDGLNPVITISRPPTPFEAWINDPAYFPGETDQAIVGPNADPDGDGSSNAVEFALGGAPNDGSNNPKVYQLTADSSDGGTANELLLTIAVRNGTPVFAGATSKSATQEGYTYTVEGSTDLASFLSTVAVVDPVTTGLPVSPPTGYTYRTFSLTGSDGLPSRGFLRVKITP